MDVFRVSTLTKTDGYTALREHAAWLDLSGRGKIRATGEDRGRLLHAMTTNQVETLKPGQGCYAFFLSAQGRILADVNLLCFEDHFLLDTEPETRTKVYEHLDRYIIADDVSLQDQTGQVATLAIEGPEAGAALAKLGAPQPTEPYSSAPWSYGTVARLDTTGKGGFFLMIPMEEKQAVASQLTGAGFPPATGEEARIVRIESGRPRYGEEITERYLVQETNQLRAVHFSKGCYLGQEIVERVRSRAQIHRVLRRLELDASEPPAARTKLKSAGADAAEIASAVFSPALGKTVALAYVRTQFAEPGTTIELDGTAGRVL
ncbi:MAG: glycine cleavage protein (aminomethyl transferase) [Bryobacterales bacterium]|nr:glycine cleavage protein (aminomethyl transferase) [Bryobacterales bacterium]